MDVDLFGTRSLLFLPASNPRAIARARDSAADLVILDLEDAVKESDKALAREAAVAAVAERWPMPVAIRINGTGTEWHADDLVAVAMSDADVLVLPMAESAEEIDGLVAVERPVMAMIESAVGVFAAPAIAKACAGLIVGTNDLSADLRLAPDAGRGPLQTALQMVLLAARAGEAAAFDGVFNRLDDPDGFAAECAESRWLGFDGKSLIHPDQIAPCHAAFAPTAAELDRARRLVDAATGGAERFEGAMIERMHVEAAERLLARS
ncbi:CoA ester lyase [Sphingomonas sp.]|uniref:HpcH/HpaI aldolase/citrate lyase family protein n=1 Tax=Sphingomonas sp. TaxID=28214 RepID=UPI00286E1AE9|nr:CoA ester lyase [Sphingomonas sp.]